MAAFSSSSSVEEQVFINYYCGDQEIRNGFVSHLVKALQSNNINVFITKLEDRGEPIETLMERIEKSRIAVVIFSERYTESIWCLREVAKIKDCLDEQKLLKVIPIFYKVETSTVKHLRGDFGDVFRTMAEGDERKKKWKKALKAIADLMGTIVDEKSHESVIIEQIVEEVKSELSKESQKAYVENVKRVLSRIKLEESQQAYVDPSENSYTETSSGGVKDEIFGIKQSLINGFKENVNRNKIRSNLGMIIGCLLLLFFIPLQIAYMSTRLIGEGGAINRIVDNVPKLPEYIPAEGTEDPRDTYTERSSSDAKTNAALLGRTFTNSQMDGKVKPPQIQVFINFRGDQLRNNFVGHLVYALRRSEINVFIDKEAQIGEDLNTLFKRIEDSGIAIVVFSTRYTESKWCLEELVKIKERVQQNLLKVIPIFYKVTPDNVKRLKGEFGDHFRDKEYMYESDEPKIKRWNEAIADVSGRHALPFDEKSSTWEVDFVESVVKEVLKMLQAISKVESG